MAIKQKCPRLEEQVAVVEECFQTPGPGKLLYNDLRGHVTHDNRQMPHVAKAQWQNDDVTGFGGVLEYDDGCYEDEQIENPKWAESWRSPDRELITQD